MVIKRSTSTEVARLVTDLLGDDDVRREVATARLAVIGPRAVDRLLSTLAEPVGAGARAAVLQALERIGDVRALPAAEHHVSDPEPEVATAAVGVLRPILKDNRADVSTKALERLTAVVLDVAAGDAVRAAALDALHDLGSDVVDPLLERLRHDPSAAVRRRAGWAVEAGTAANPSLEAIVAGDLPPDPESVKGAVGESWAAVPLPVLHRLIVAIRTREGNVQTQDERRAWTAARGAVHQALAARGSRVALYDLREALEAMADEVPVGMIAALSAIGDGSCLEPLAEAIAASRDAWARSQLTDAFQRIRERERLTRRHVVLKRVLTKYPDLERARV